MNRIQGNNLSGKIYFMIQKILIAAPVALLLSTWVIFYMLTSRFGLKAGYLSGFLFYWIVWCLLFPLRLLGKNKFLAMFRRVAQPFCPKRWPGLILLFGLWHYALQSVTASGYPGGAHSLVLFTVTLGLMWGWVAWKMRSIRWTIIAHIILDFSGMGALFYFS